MTAPRSGGRPGRRGGALAGLAALLAGGLAGAQTPIPPSPQDFAAAAAQSNAYLVLAAETALAQSRTPTVRAFAEEILREEGVADQALAQAAAAAGLPPPPKAMGGDEARLLGALQGLRGAAFDRLYARQAALVHAQALAVDQSFAAAGADGALKQAAEAAAPGIERRLAAARSLETALGGD